MKRQEQLGVSSQGAKDLPQGLAERTFASSDRTRRWTCLLRVTAQAREEEHKTPQQKQAPPDMQTGQSIRACLRRGVPADHEAHSRSGDSCEESQRLSFGGSAPRRPKQGKAGPRQDAAKEAAGTSVARAKQTRHAYIRTQVGHLNRIMSAHDSRSHSHSGEPTEELSVRGPERLATWSNEETMTSKHSGWRGRRWCWSVQQTTRQRVPQCTIAGDRAEQSPTKGAVCRPSRHRLSDEVFPATHESGNTRGTAEFTTMPRVKQPSSGDNALYTHSRVKGRGASGSG